MRDMVGHVGEPRVEQIEQDANAGQEEYRCQRHLDHMSRHIDWQVRGGHGHRFKPQAACVGWALAVSGAMWRDAPKIGHALSQRQRRGFANWPRAFGDGAVAESLCRRGRRRRERGIAVRFAPMYEPASREGCLRRGQTLWQQQ
jgi:hypothetical protein